MPKLVFVLLSLLLSLSVWSQGPTNIVYLEDAGAAAAARIEMIQNATKEIKMSTHIFSEDLAGNRLLAELIKAKRKNPKLKVQILFDSWESKKNLTKPMIELLEKEGIEVYKFRPLTPKYALNFNRRLHDKLFIVDGGKMIQGDRNTTQNYFSMASEDQIPAWKQFFGAKSTKPHAAFVSKEFYYEGQVVEDASRYYDELIKNPACARQAYSGTVTPEIKAKLDLMEKHMKKNLNNILAKSKNWKAGMEPVYNVTFHHDEVATKGKKLGSFEPILDMVKNAKNRIIIENPYIVMTQEMKDAFAAASARGVKITIITNSPMGNDMGLVGAAWESDRKFLASLGADIYEHPGTIKGNLSKWNLKGRVKNLMEGAIHNKAIIVDNEVAMGSFNMDVRSRLHNLEVMVRIRNKNFMHQVMQKMMFDIQHRGYVQTVKAGKTVNVLPSRCATTKTLSWMLKYFL